MENLRKFTNLNLAQITHCFQAVMNTVIRLILTKEDKCDVLLKFFGKISKRDQSLSFFSEVPKREANNEISYPRTNTVGSLLRKK